MASRSLFGRYGLVAGMQFYTSRWRTLALMAGGLAMAVLSGFAAIDSVRLKLQVVGWFGVVFFGLVPFLGIRQLRRKGPSIIIDTQGFEDARWGIGPFAWDDIAAIWIAKIYGSAHLCVTVQNPDVYIDRLPPLKQKIARATQAQGITPFSFAFSGLTPGLKEAMAYIKANWPEKVASKEREAAPPAARLLRYALHYAAAQSIIIAISILVLVLFVDVTLNTGVAIGGALAAGVYAATVFVRREGRAPTSAEKWRLAALSTTANWLVSTTAMALLIVTTGEEADYAYVWNIMATLSPLMLAGVVAITSLLLLTLSAFAYGTFAKLLVKSAANTRAS